MKFITNFLFFFLLLCISGYGLSGDRLIVVVNKDNAVNTLTNDELTKIFMGETRTWEDNSLVQPILLENAEDGTFFKNLITTSKKQYIKFWMKKSLTGEKKPPKIVRSEGQIKEYILINKGAIGIIPETDFDERFKKVQLK